MRRSIPRSPVLLALVTPLVIYACTLPDYKYDDDAFARAQGIAGEGNSGGNSESGQGGFAGVEMGGHGGFSGKPEGGNNPGGNEPGGNNPGGNNPGGNEPGGNEPGGEAGEGGSTTAGMGGNPQGGEAHGGTGQGGAGQSGAGQSGAGQGGAGQGGKGGSTVAGAGGSTTAGQGGGGQGGAGKGGGGSGGQGPTECVIKSFDFNDCSSDFTTEGNKNLWECGKPAIGPNSDHSGGGSLWGTRLKSKPEQCSDSFLNSPEMDLSVQNGRKVKLQVWHWEEFRVCDPNKGLFGACKLACEPPFNVPVDSYSGGVLEVFTGSNWVVVPPEIGYGASSQELWVNGSTKDSDGGTKPPCQESTLHGKTAFAAKGVNKQWILSTFDISKYMTSSFRFRFHFASAPSEDCFPNTAGWFVDDIKIFYAGACQ